MNKTSLRRPELARIIGDSARRAREVQGFTQEEVAAEVDLKTGSYSKIERGITLPSVMTLSLLLTKLRVSADVLLGRADASFTVGELPWRDPDPPELRRLIRRLRKVPWLWRFFHMLLSEVEQRQKRRT